MQTADCSIFLDQSLRNFCPQTECLFGERHRFWCHHRRTSAQRIATIKEITSLSLLLANVQRSARTRYSATIALDGRLNRVFIWEFDITENDPMLSSAGPIFYQTHTHTHAHTGVPVNRVGFAVTCRCKFTSATPKSKQVSSFFIKELTNTQWKVRSDDCYKDTISARRTASDAACTSAQFRSCLKAQHAHVKLKPF